jgi:hypothetical protein
MSKFLQVPTKARLEFRTGVGLHHLDAERQRPKYLVDEADRRPLMQAP